MLWPQYAARVCEGESDQRDIMQRLEQYDAFPVPTHLIHCDSNFNCRGYIEPQEVGELAADIKLRGLKDPIDLQPACDVPGGLPPGKEYRVVAGHCRFIAVTVHLEWKEIAAKIHHGLTELQARIHNLQENDKRKNLNPLQEAFALQAIIAQYPTGTSARQIYMDLGKPRRWFTNRVDMLNFPEEIQQMIAAGRIKLHDIEIIKRRATPEYQLKYAKAIADSKRGRGKKCVFAGTPLLRTFKRRRSKLEINALIDQCLNLGITLAGTRALAWAAGYLSDADIQYDIHKECHIKSTPSNAIE